MNFANLIDAHVETRADITIAARPVTPEDAPQMGIFRFDRDQQIVGFEEKPPAERLSQIGASVPAGSALVDDAGKPFVASMGIYVFSRSVLFDVLRRHAFVDFGREVIPASLDAYRVRPYLFRDFWADVGTIASFYDANVMLTARGAPFRFYDPNRPIYTHARFLPGSRFCGTDVRDAIVAEGCFLDDCRVDRSVVGIRTRIASGARVSRSVLLGADFYEAEDSAPARGDRPVLGIGRDVVLDRVIVDKNARIGDGARLVNEAGVQEADGDGWCIRDGIVVVPKGAAIAPGMVV
jgi:glucose-1-phosphate adenylyltransferase